MDKILYVLVTGSRNWPYPNIVTEALKALKANYNGPGITLVHGDCPTGADRQANDIAEQLGFGIVRFPANWNLYGKAAGPIRNRLMVDTIGLASKKICLAFIHENSRGAVETLQMIQKARLPWARYASFDNNPLVTFNDSFNNHELMSLAEPQIRQNTFKA